MKKLLKWGIISTLVLSVIGFAVTYKVYSDMKNTADQLYTPTKYERSDMREAPVNVASAEPFSALILGVDERDGDSGRSDTMIVLTVNPTLKTTKLLSIPRDTYTEIIGEGLKDKINHAYAFGGIEMSMKTVENLLDIPIDYVARVNMESFTDIIDIVGGISVNNALAFDYDGERFPIGEIELDGETALKFVRMRYEDPNGDFGRQNRQKQVIQGVLREATSVGAVLNYKSIFETLEDNVQINVVFDELLNISKNYGSSFKTIEQIYLNNGSSSIMNGIYYYIPNEQELQGIQDELREHLGI
ncbi:LCP family glycopolymer transferase [Lysinibacillus sp. 54212]|uniref:LCP family glycopolymer transferase n=1 Tax=Lysinibacillus sp. 54212 TaxID=3119829 RepID=UPI002FC9FE80